MKHLFKLTGLLLMLSFVLLNCTSSKQPTELTLENEEATASPKVIILAVDGGGIKGVIPAYFLSQIEQKVGKSSYQLFDVMGGTSTGGIISVALTSPNKSTGKPFTANEIVNIYQNDGAKIFVPQNCRVEYCAKYYASNGNQGIEPYLQSILGTSDLKANYNFMQKQPGNRVQQMFTTSYAVNSTGNVIPSPQPGKDYGPYLFNWFDARNNADDNYFVWEAARATSAAPTYFPVAQVGGNTAPRSSAPQRWVIDGGVMSNDPAVWGVTEALRTGIATKLEDIVVISLGTGIYKGSAGVGIHNNKGVLTPDNGNWSKMPWVVLGMYDLEGAKNDGGTILSIILNAVQEVSNSQLEAMTKSGLTYYRLEPSLTKAQSEMDDIQPANISSLMKTAQQYIQSGEGAKTFNSIVNELK